MLTVALRSADASMALLTVDGDDRTICDTVAEFASQGPALTVSVDGQLYVARDGSNYALTDSREPMALRDLLTAALTVRDLAVTSLDGRTVAATAAAERHVFDRLTVWSDDVAADYPLSATRRDEFADKKRDHGHTDKGNTAERGYDSKYETKRAELLKDHPNCHWCRTAPATEADHYNNGLVPSCAPCNNARSHEQQRAAAAVVDIAEFAAAALAMPGMMMLRADEHWNGPSGQDAADAHDTADAVTADSAVTVHPADAVALLQDLGNRPEPSDLTKVTIAGHPDLFGSVARNQLRRADMPVVSAEHLDEFAAHLHARGIRTRTERVDPLSLKATQNELDGRKTGQMVTAMLHGTMDPHASPIWAAADGYILDGHHRYAAAAVLAAAGDVRPLTIVRALVPMTQLIGQARAFNEAEGIASKHHGMVVDTAAFRPRTFRVAGVGFAFNPSQPRDDHGRWASSGSSAATTGGADDKIVVVAADRMLAAVIHAKAVKAEPGISAHLAELMAPTGGKFYKFDFRMKQEADIAIKIERVMVEKSISREEAAADIKDAVRYTLHFAHDNMAASAQSTIDALRADGNQVRVKNSWKEPPTANFRGINASVTNRDGVIYEVQIHTPHSQEVADAQHLLYEEQRVLPKSNPRWQILEDRQIKMSHAQIKPPGIDGVA